MLSINPNYYTYESKGGCADEEEFVVVSNMNEDIMNLKILQNLRKMVVARGGKRPARLPFSGVNKNTVYGFMRTLMPLLRYLGLAPVRKVREGGATKYKEHVSVVYLLQVGCECILVSYLTINLVINFRKEVHDLYSFNAIELFACIMFAAHVIFSKIKTFEYRKQCIESFDGIHEVDQLFKRLGITVSYKNIIFGTKAIACVFCTVFPMLLMVAYGSQAHFIALILQIWRIGAINMFGLFLIVLHSKYRKLNKFLKLYIKENEEGIPLTDTTMQPLEVIDTIADVYDKLCTSGKKWNAMHNLPLSINLLFYSVASTLFSIAYYTSPQEMVAMIPVFIYLVFEFFYVLTVSQITRNECQKIMLNINEMSCCYIDNDLWRARNSFLLQTLHQRVNFTVLHVFPLDHSMAIKIGGIVLSVLVLTIQIRQLEEAQ